LRIALLTAHFAPDAAPSAMIATRLSDSLARRGHEILVGTAAPSYRSTAELTGPLETGVLVRRSRAAKTRFRTYANYHVAVMTWSSWLRQADVILSMSPPISLGTLAAFIGGGKPTVYNVQDVLAEFLRRTGKLRNPAALRILEGLERFTYARTSAIATVGEAQRRFLISQGVPSGKIVTIENFADVDTIAPREVDREYRLAMGIPADAFCVLYAGNFGLVNDLDVLLATAEALSSRPDIVFLFAGGGREWSRAVALAKGRRNVVLLGHRPVAEVPRLYAAANVGLVTLRAGLSSCSVPSKVYTILASGRPFVAAIDPDSDVVSIARRSAAGIAVGPGDARGLASAILELAANPSRRRQMGESGYRYVLDNNTSSVIALRYESLFEQIIVSVGGGARAPRLP
jgi:colanic acid biosynthesis glycosyl transferase WcaI